MRSRYGFRCKQAEEYSEYSQYRRDSTLRLKDCPKGLRERHFTLFLALITAFCLSLAHAEEWSFETRSPDYAGVRAIGLGNAYTGVAEGAFASVWNPAGMIQSVGVAVTGQMKMNQRQQWAFDPKAIQFVYRPWALAWANKIAVRLPGRTPDYTYYSVACQSSSHTALGASVSFERRHPWDTYQWFGIHPQLHLAALIYLWQNTRFAIVMQGSQGVDLGMSYTWKRRLFTTRLFLETADGIRPRAFAGIEWPFAHNVCTRLGLSAGSPTAGIGWQWRILHLDYAWIREYGESNHFAALEISR